jgi:hypothetical protein
MAKKKPAAKKKTAKSKKARSNKYDKKLKLKEGIEWTDLVSLSLKPNKK